LLGLSFELVHPTSRIVVSLRPDYFGTGDLDSALSGVATIAGMAIFVQWPTDRAAR